MARLGVLLRAGLFAPTGGALDAAPSAWSVQTGSVSPLDQRVVIMTSNIGSHHLLEGVTEDADLTEDARTRVSEALRQHFRPEFLNRVDDVVMFKPLSLSEVEEILQLIIFQLERRLSDQHLALDVSAEALSYIAQNGFDPLYGARPLKRYVQHALESRLGRLIVAGEVESGDTISVTLVGGQLDLRVLRESAEVRGAA